MNAVKELQKQAARSDYYCLKTFGFEGIMLNAVNSLNRSGFVFSLESDIRFSEGVKKVHDMKIHCGAVFSKSPPDAMVGNDYEIFQYSIDKTLVQEIVHQTSNNKRKNCMEVQFARPDKLVTVKAKIQIDANTGKPTDYDLSAKIVLDWDNSSPKTISGPQPVKMFKDLSSQDFAERSTINILSALLHTIAEYPDLMRSLELQHSQRNADGFVVNTIEMSKDMDIRGQKVITSESSAEYQSDDAEGKVHVIEKCTYDITRYSDIHRAINSRKEGCNWMSAAVSYYLENHLKIKT